MATDDNSWRTQEYRQNVIAKIDQVLQNTGVSHMRNSADMENYVFQKAKTKEEYHSYVGKVISFVTENHKNKAAARAAGAAGGQDPMGALQTLTRQATGNNNQVMGMAGGQNLQGMVPQQTVNAASNLLQSFNQRPGGPAVGMNMQNMQNKMPGMGMMGGQASTMGNMGQMQSMQNSQMMNQINQMPAGNLNQQINQMGPGPAQQMGQVNPRQVNLQQQQQQQQQQMMRQENMQQMNMSQAQMGQQMQANQMQQNVQQQMQVQRQPQMVNQMGGGPMAGNMQGGPQNINQMGGGPVAGQINVQQQLQQVQQMNQAQQMSQAQQMNQVQQMNQAQQMGHMQRKPVEMINAGFPGPRNVTPNQFLRQSPSPSVPSPVALAAPASNQMIPSPALVPSSPQHTMMAGPRSVGMVPSPSASLNTPVGAGADSPQDEQAYREKVRQLRRFIEPMRKMITKMESEGNNDKMSKMTNLLELLSNPTRRVPLKTILKCEVVLEKMDFKLGEGSVGPPVTPMKEHHIFTPLLEAVSANFQSPMANHTLQRTFGPCLEALFGPEIKNLPPPLKKQKVEESVSEIPDVLQGEIARLDQRFKVSLDPAQQNGSKCIQLICWLDDRHLPCVPPVSVTVPSDYPLTPPRCVMAPHEYTTAFLSAVQKALTARTTKLPRCFSVSQLLDTWEMSVRQASAPTQTPVSSATVLMGL